MRFFTLVGFGLVVLSAGTARAENSTSAPRPIPLTRPEMKQYIEDMKQRTPRIPLPPLSEEEKANLGDREAGYESRLRALYMPAGDGRGFSGNFGGSRPGGDGNSDGRKAPTTGRGAGGGFGRDSDPAMTLDYKFKTSLFWIVSRTNNCQYCLGHQESKLLSAGMKEDEIAALDCDWQIFTPKEQAAFAFARRFTLEPHKFSDTDIDELKKHFTDLQILEMILSMAGNNAINRWKEGVGVPQSAGGGGFGRRTEGAPVAEARPEAHSYLTHTSEKFQTKITLVAPLSLDDAGKPTRQTVAQRPKLESRGEVEQALAKAQKRTPRLPLVDESKAREILAEDAPAGPLPQWMRLLVNFPVNGKRTVASVRSADEKGDLTPLIKAQVSWIIARQDRAWYATGQAKLRLKALGQSDEQIHRLDGNWDEFAPRERALFTVARKLAASPVVLTDDDVTAAVKLAGNRDVVQIVNYTTNRASFDRITEATGLQLEP
jgi:alkylhydroperoxidase family enzyme